MSDIWLYSKETGELYHYGVLGMKWGKRRKRNRISAIERKAKKQGWSDDALNAKKLQTKKINQLSNDELQRFNKRAELVSKYKASTDTSKKVEKFTKKFIATAGTVTAVMAAASAYKKMVDPIIDKVGDWVVKDIRI